VPDDLAPSVERLVRLAGRAEAPLLDAMDELTEGLDALLCRQRLLLSE
jgi:hypothetical protein